MFPQNVLNLPQIISQVCRNAVKNPERTYLLVGIRTCASCKQHVQDINHYIYTYILLLLAPCLIGYSPTSLEHIGTQLYIQPINKFLWILNQHFCNWHQIHIEPG